jgi:hypothetical protein
LRNCLLEFLNVKKNRMSQTTVQVLPSVQASVFRYSYPVTLTFPDGNQLHMHRYYSDFAKLREELCVNNNLASNKVVPSIPGKKWNVKSRARERRRASFQYLLEWCLRYASNQAEVLQFFQTDSLSVHPSKTNCINLSVTEKPSQSNKLEKNIRQSIVKFAILTLIWILAWRAMLSSSPKVTMTTDLVLQPITKQMEAPAIHYDLTNPVENALKLVEATFDVNEHDSVDVEKEFKNETLSVKDVSGIISETEVEPNLSQLQVTTDAISPAVQISLEPIKDSRTNAVPSDLYNLTSTSEATSLPAQAGPEIKFENSEQNSPHAETLATVEVADQPAKKQVDFFFTPLHGVIVFTILYVFVLGYSKFFPTAERLPNEIEFPEDTPSVANDVSLAASEKLNATLTFEQAENVLVTLPNSIAEDWRDCSRAVAYWMRATGEECTSAKTSVMQDLEAFAEEAISFSPENAKRKFVELVQDKSRLVEKHTNEVVASNKNQKHGEELIIKWWDAKMSQNSWRDTQQVPQNNEQATMQMDDSLNMTSFDSTDISLLSVSPIARSGDEQDSKVAITATSISFQEDCIEQEKVDSLMSSLQFATGTFLGFAGTAIAFNLVRKARRLI